MFLQTSFAQAFFVSNLRKKNTTRIREHFLRSIFYLLCEVFQQLIGGIVIFWDKIET